MRSCFSFPPNTVLPCHQSFCTPIICKNCPQLLYPAFWWGPIQVSKQLHSSLSSIREVSSSVSFIVVTKIYNNSYVCVCMCCISVQNLITFIISSIGFSLA